MSDTTKQIRDQRNTVWTRMRETLQTAESAEGGLSGELLTTYRAAETDFDRLSAELEARERADQIAAEMAAPQKVSVPEGRSVETPEGDVRQRAFDHYLRRGTERMAPELRDALEYRDLSDLSSSGSAGGFTVPQGFLQKITERMKYFGPMRQIANVIRTGSGQDLPWPNNDDTGIVAAVLGENVQISEADPSFGQKMLKAYVWTSGLVRVPNTLINDSAFDIESWLTRKFGQRFGRGQNTAFTVGAGHGSNTAQGIVGNLSTTAYTTATAGGNALTYADLVGWFHSLDPAYRNSPDVCFMLSDSALKAARLILDGNNRPIFVPAGSFGGFADANQPDTLLGKKLYINNDLLAMGSAHSGVGIFGDISAAYIIRDVLDMQTLRLTERYADYLQTGFFAFSRTDGIVDDGYAAVQLNTAT